MAGDKSLNLCDLYPVDDRSNYVSFHAEPKNDIFTPDDLAYCNAMSRKGGRPSEQETFLKVYHGWFHEDNFRDGGYSC